MSTDTLEKIIKQEKIIKERKRAIQNKIYSTIGRQIVKQTNAKNWEEFNQKYEIKRKTERPKF